MNIEKEILQYKFVVTTYNSSIEYILDIANRLHYEVIYKHQRFHWHPREKFIRIINEILSHDSKHEVDRRFIFLECDDLLPYKNDFEKYWGNSLKFMEIQKPITEEVKPVKKTKHKEPIVD